jgi:broad specificity phosphatase PhoE
LNSFFRLRKKVSIDIEIKIARPEPPDQPVPARPPPARLLLIRHGESTWNEVHRIQGQLDPPLSDRGRRQAELLARRLSSRRPDAIYVSDLKRTIETAAPIEKAIGLQAVPMPDLREVFLGEWEGLTNEEVTTRYPEAWAKWTVEPSWDLVPDGEGGEAFEGRVESALQSVVRSHPHGEVILVTHGGVIQVALHQVMGRPSRGLFPFRISNASITILEQRNGRTVIAGVNDVGHLEDGGRPGVSRP